MSSSAEHLLFKGGKYKRANGHIAQTITRFSIDHRNVNGAGGIVRHGEVMGSFDMPFHVDCDETEMHFSAQVGGRARTDFMTTMIVLPEIVFFKFPDGTRSYHGAAVPAARELPLAAELSSERYQQFIRDGEPTEPIEKLISGETHRIIARHTTRLRFIAEALFARFCP